MKIRSFFVYLSSTVALVSYALPQTNNVAPRQIHTASSSADMYIYHQKIIRNKPNHQDNHIN